MSLYIRTSSSKDPQVLDRTEHLFAVLVANAFEEKPSANSLDHVKHALLQEVDVHARTVDGETLLIVASKSALQSCVQPLLERGANVNARDYLGNTALHYAAENTRPDAARVLVAFGADIHAVNQEKEQPLHRAAVSTEDHAQTLKLLLELGAHVNVQRADGITPLRLATITGKDLGIAALLNAGANVYTADRGAGPGTNLSPSVAEHLSIWGDKLAQDHIPKNTVELLALASVMELQNRKAAPEPREMIQRLFTTLPHDKKINKLYEEYFGHKRAPEVSLQQMRERAQHRGVGL